MTETDCDVVILGAGVGGTFLATLLARAGLSVLVLGRQPDFPAKGAEFLKPRGLQVLDRHGILPDVEQRGALRRTSIEYYHDGSLLQVLDFESGGPPGHYLIVPYREILAAICAAGNGRVEYRFGTSVAAMDSGDHEVERIRLDDGGTVRARIVVGADGGSSAAHTYIGAPVARYDFDHVMRATLIPLTDGVCESNRLYFGSTGWFAYLYPLTGTQARVFVAAPTAQDPGDRIAPELLSGFVSRSDDALALIGEAVFERAPVSACLATRYHRDNVVVLGSAAFNVHPMTGLGMSYTLEDAEILADVITAALQRGESLPNLLAARYVPRRSAHRDLLAYGNRLASSYRSPQEYRHAFDPSRHGADKLFRSATAPPPGVGVSWVQDRSVSEPAL